ncbi:MAG TPA: response regulator transcription factor [Candidatus Saccharimonadales bacterium]
MRILVVEDEHKIAQAVKDGLEQESYAVDVAYDGESGLNTALNDDYDLIILDVMLPGLNGYEVCKGIRAAGNHTPILMLTAKDQNRDVVQGLNTGADDYLVKPFSFEVLLARVRALLRRPQDTLGEVLQVADLSLNTVTKEVKRGKQPIALSAKEYALLEYLLRNERKVLSKNNIMTHVWNFDADILPNTVEVFIAYLRAKIDKPFKGPQLIHTVRGFGYKLGPA